MSGEVVAAEKARECWAWRAGKRWTNQEARDFAGGLVSETVEARGQHQRSFTVGVLRSPVSFSIFLVSLFFVQCRLSCSQWVLSLSELISMAKVKS